MDGLRAGTRTRCNMGFKTFRLKSEDIRLPEWTMPAGSHGGSTPIAPVLDDGNKMKRIEDKVILTVRNAGGLPVLDDDGLYFIPNQIILLRLPTS